MINDIQLKKGFYFEGIEVSSCAGGDSNQKCVIVEWPADMRSVGKSLIFLSLLSFEPYLSISVQGKMRHNTVRHELEMTGEIIVDITEMSQCWEVDEQHEQQMFWMTKKKMHFLHCGKVQKHQECKSRWKWNVKRRHVSQELKILVH